MLTEFHIGLDDTDSRLGGCTTYTATLLLETLVREGYTPLDLPWLVRLNPNIPWKTRGNAALAIHVLADLRDADDVKKIALDILEGSTDPSMPGTDPALVFIVGQRPAALIDFANRALHDVLSVKEARRLARIVGAETHLFGKSRGLIGALAAVGSELEPLHTFEIIAYRTKENLGTPRRVDLDSVRKMDSEYRGRTFNNLDPETGRILICPHGPDPVLFGIRGEDPESLIGAFRCVLANEPIDRVMLFKTNQGTDAHLTRHRRISELRPHASSVVIGRVETEIRVLRGGHLVFTLSDETGMVECAAYEPSGSFRRIVRQLLPGDLVKAYGGVRKRPERRLTVNLERLDVLELAQAIRFENPCCVVCDSRCESMGRSQGFRCRKCHLKYSGARKVHCAMVRTLDTGVYLPPPRAHRHLTRPASRLFSEQLQASSLAGIA